MFSNLIRSVGLSAAQRDFANYIAALDGASDEELGQLLIAAHEARFIAESVMGLTPAVFLTPFAISAASIAKVQSALLDLNKSIGKSGQEALGAGIKLWLFTLRGVCYPELRSDGRRMWGHLGRGIPSALIVAAAMPNLRLSKEVAAIPQGLEPRDSNGREYMPGIPGQDIVCDFLTTRLEAEELENQRLIDMEKQAAEAEYQRTANALTMHRTAQVRSSAASDVKPDSELESLRVRIEAARARYSGS